jgi:hypothetical protein
VAGLIQPSSFDFVTVIIILTRFSWIMDWEKDVWGL